MVRLAVRDTRWTVNKNPNQRRIEQGTQWKPENVSVPFPFCYECKIVTRVYVAVENTFSEPLKFMWKNEKKKNYRRKWQTKRKPIRR